MSDIVWKDVDISFERDQTGDVKTLVNEKSIEESIANIFQTMPGSRRMVPEAFSPIWGVLFEPIDSLTASNLGNLLLKAIERWEDRITVGNLHVTSVPDENIYEVKLTYTVKGTNQPETLLQIIRAK